MIFVDSNIPMYLVGESYRHKDRSLVLVTRLLRNKEHLVTDIEVYQEILHRYTAINRPDAIDSAFDVLDAIVDDVLGFGLQEIRAARSIIDSIPGLSARDALHLAVMRGAGITRVLSFDRGFDRCPGIERIS
ncbi:MAG: type II toxin-antitoxin system VapC family toxin [Acidimicrobiia bacterium]|nr:type II toxin-antitoxin system VapC family toxin [bacterium]MXX64963.1 type II toxin-antitoxin system VapC family toxin [Acidimicrobiia bacterium]MCY3653002.1 type II toxin-antitoxin system VapC family toxin [bacterium]MDE0644377.1 type II toxin-antitoxin system VapC family toxin [bacterium]MXZ07458.1 type II toxin-antitoxin system VapC family toxin [Acidimicrobiia bacterium]